MSRLTTYYEWLVRIVDDGRAPRYEDLLHHLYETPFEWYIANDDNRLADGMELRYQFLEEEVPFKCNDISNVGNEFCSMLEVLVALARRMESVMYESDYGDRTATWFWTIIDNLDLEWMDFGNFDERFFAEKMDFVLKRRYGRDGKGGLFYTNRRDLDFRNMEIWYQMMHFLCENY